MGTPNFKHGIGILTTSRYDFQDHIDGYNFRHQANQIDLFPILQIGSNSISNVQDAVRALTNIVNPPIIQDASTAVKGIIQLSGDIGGVATNVSVKKIQGKAVSALTPNAGDVLTWSGTLSMWLPAPTLNIFNAGGDLSGNNVLQSVISLTGNAGVVSISCNSLNFISGASPIITQNDNSSNNGNNTSIISQSALSSNKNGGALILSGGGKGSGGLRGGVSLQMGAGDTTMLQVSEPAIGRRAISLLHIGALTTLDMPTGTGDMVMYIRDTATPPTTGNPLNGTIVYSSGGQLWIKQQDGNNFFVGSIPNPSIWGSSGQQTYTNRSYIKSSVGSSATAFTYSLPDNITTKIDVILIGKATSTSDGASYNLSMSYLRNGGSPIALGTLTSSDPRTTSGASAAWALPNINFSGNDLQIITGYSTTNTINWLVITQLSMSQG